MSSCHNLQLPFLFFFYIYKHLAIWIDRVLYRYRRRAASRCKAARPAPLPKREQPRAHTGAERVGWKLDVKHVGHTLERNAIDIIIVAYQRALI